MISIQSEVRNDERSVFTFIGSNRLNINSCEPMKNYNDVKMVFLNFVTFSKIAK